MRQSKYSFNWKKITESKLFFPFAALALILLIDLIIIPNSKLAQAVVTNYHLPEKRLSFSIPISVSCDCDPDQIEAIVGEEARKGATEIKGLLSDPAPVVRFIPGFGSSSLDFTLVCHVSDFLDQSPVQHELRKRILKRFRKENIEIPYPVRTVFLREEQLKSHTSVK